MRANNASSIYVAPLQIKKATDDVLVSAGPTKSRETQLTENGTMEEETPYPLFQNYLKAIYPFSPSPSVSPSTITLSLSVGDIILVHSVHTNGWADGTLLENGA